MRDLGRLAIVDHLSAGGVSRFLLALISHLAELYPATTIVYYVSTTNIERDRIDEKLGRFANVTLRPIDSPMPPEAEPVVEEPQQRGPLWTSLVRILKAVPWLHRAMLGTYIRIKGLSVHEEAAPEWWRYRMPDDVVAELGDFDAVYFGWPYFTEPVYFPSAMVGTFHDFHFRHFPEAYLPEHRELAERQTAEWLRRCTTAVTSTRFIRDELRQFYPEADPPVEVIYLAPYGFHTPEPGAVEETIGRLGIGKPYALFGGGRSKHKNLARLFEALAILKKQDVKLQLVLTGIGIEAIGQPSDAPPDDPIHVLNQTIERGGLVLGEDVLVLGYVSNADVDALTAGADVVVSASLYEAGCGPAMDAWQAGVPVAFSNIPPFLEQIERFGAQAWVFDPMDPADIADKLRSAVYETERSQAMVSASLHAFEAYTWDDVAREYYKVFAEAAESGPSTTMQSARPNGRPSGRKG